MTMKFIRHTTKYNTIHTIYTHPFNGPFSGTKKVKNKVFPYSLPSVGPGADPGIQAMSPQVT